MAKIRNGSEQKPLPDLLSLGCSVASILLLHAVLGQASFVSWVAAGIICFMSASAWSTNVECKYHYHQNLVALVLGGVAVCSIAVLKNYNGESMSVMMWEAYRGCSLGILILFIQHLVEKCSVTTHKAHCLPGCPEPSQVEQQSQLDNSSKTQQSNHHDDVGRIRRIPHDEKSGSEVEDPLTFFRRFVSEDKENRRQQPGEVEDETSTVQSNSNCLPEQQHQQNIMLHSEAKSPKHLNPFDQATSTGELTAKCKLRSVRFADELGGNIETVFEFEKDMATDGSFKRLLVLLLLPARQSYEFVALDYECDVPDNSNDNKENRERKLVRVSQVLKQLPSIASDPNMSKQQFVRLIRIHTPPLVEGISSEAIEMINALSIQSYDLQNDEIVVAVPKGSNQVQVIDSTKQVLQNPKLIKALKRSKRWSTPLLTLDPSQ